MDHWEYEARQTELQRTLREWLLKRDLNAFVTLTSRAEDGIDYETARKVFGTFAHSLKCHLFAAKSKKRIEMIPVVEGHGMGKRLATRLGLRQGTHIHCLMNLPGNPMDHVEAIRKLWMSASSVCGDPKVYCPNSNNWFLELGTPLRRRIFMNYSVKTCSTNTDAMLWDFVPVRRVT